MQGYHIITELETGETLVDRHTKAIIGAADADEGTHVFEFTDCAIGDVAATAAGALQAAEGAIADFPAALIEEVKKAVKKSLSPQNRKKGE